MHPYSKKLLIIIIKKSLQPQGGASHFFQWIAHFTWFTAGQSDDLRELLPRCGVSLHASFALSVRSCDLVQETLIHFFF